VTNEYVDQIGTFQYKGRTIEAHVVKRGPTTTPGGGPAGRRTLPIWTVMVDEDRFRAFPASPNDTEDEVRERLKRWIDEHVR
jgi:hypothetical protein